MSKRLNIAVRPWARRCARPGRRLGHLAWMMAAGLTAGSCRSNKDSSSDAAVDEPSLAETVGAETPRTPWVRGGPSPHPTSSTGPTSLPTLQWAVSLGHVISARAAMGSQGEHRVAYAGTHGGRVAGVTLDGEQAGAVVLDVQLGGMVWSTPVIDGAGHLLVGTDDDRLTALSPRTGTIVWSIGLGDCQPPRARGPEGTRCDVDGGPTVAPSGDIYVGAAGLVRMTPQGRVVWSFPAAPARAPHVYSTPAVTADAIYFGAQDGRMYAVHHDGTRRWSVDLGPDVDSSPAIGPDGTVYVGADDGRVRAFTPDGRLQWVVRTGKDIRSAIAVDEHSGVYATSLDGSVYALTAAGVVRWVFPTGGPIFASPVIDDHGHLFVGSTDHWLYAITEAGELLWKYELPADVDASVALTPSGYLVVGCDDGVLRAFR